MASTEVQLYTGEAKDYYSQWQLGEMGKKLDPRLVSKRKGGGNRTLQYIEGHDAIDQANRIFGYGNWAYRPLSLEQVVLLDPMTGEPVGIEYKALVELTVRGAIAPIVDVGSQPVATWTVEDQIMQRRLKAARDGKSKVDESEFTPIEKREARVVIVEAHEQAKKGAVTDALKRALRAFGEQFGNGLYGDGRVDFTVSEENTVDATSHQQNGTRQVVAMQRTPLVQAMLDAREVGMITGTTKEERTASWEEQVIMVFGKLISSEEQAKPENIKKINAAIMRHKGAAKSA